MYTNNRRIGTITYNPYYDRHDVCFPDGTNAGGLHCGDSFEILVSCRWISTWVEMDVMYEYWYLIGIADCIPLGGKSTHVEKQPRFTVG